MLHADYLTKLSLQHIRAHECAGMLCVGALGAGNIGHVQLLLMHPSMLQVFWLLGCPFRLCFRLGSIVHSEQLSSQG